MVYPSIDFCQSTVSVGMCLTLCICERHSLETRQGQKGLTDAHNRNKDRRMYHSLQMAPSIFMLLAYIVNPLSIFHENLLAWICSHHSAGCAEQCLMSLE